MRAFLLLLVLGCIGLGSADAQWKRPRVVVRHDDRDRWSAGPAMFGVRGGHDFEEGVTSAGAQLRFPLVRQLLLVPSGDVYLDSDDARTEWQLNADLAVQPDELGGLYAGIGAAFVNRDFELDGDGGVRTGFNLLLGLQGGRLLDTRVEPFVEARWTEVEDYSPFRLLAGIDVPVR